MDGTMSDSLLNTAALMMRVMRACVSATSCVVDTHSLRMSQTNSTRTSPNILITGTPGTGKTSTADAVAQQAGLQHILHVTDIQGLHEGRDEEFDSWIIDEDKVCDELEAAMGGGGVVADHHGCDFFPERWFDLVVVLRADTSYLYDRLEKRGYSQKKLNENMECEIMQIVLEEATANYKAEIIKELKSNTVEDMEKNVEAICTWIQQFKDSRSYSSVRLTDEGNT